MFYRFVTIIITALVLVSCEFYKKKNIDTNSLINTNITYNSVDVFPLFPGCENVENEDNDQRCSKTKLAEYIYSALSENEIVTSESINGKVNVTLLISNKGKVSLESIVASEKLMNQIPNIEVLISDALEKLPILKPAIKRGVLVNTKVILPIVVTTH